MYHFEGQISGRSAIYFFVFGSDDTQMAVLDFDLEQQSIPKNSPSGNRWR